MGGEGRERGREGEKHGARARGREDGMGMNSKNWEDAREKARRWLSSRTKEEGQSGTNRIDESSRADHLLPLPLSRLLPSQARDPTNRYHYGQAEHSGSMYVSSSRPILSFYSCSLLSFASKSKPPAHPLAFTSTDYGRNDPVANKILRDHAVEKGLVPPEDKSIVRVQLRFPPLLVSTVLVETRADSPPLSPPSYLFRSSPCSLVQRSPLLRFTRLSPLLASRPPSSSSPSQQPSSNPTSEPPSSKPSLTSLKRTSRVWCSSRRVVSTTLLISPRPLLVSTKTNASNLTDSLPFPFPPRSFW